MTEEEKAVMDSPSDVASPAPESAFLVGNEVTGNSAKASPTPANVSTAPIFPPPKTDKPRPHVCATCTRSFARLEHLKRHERSHTKEKPFECPECTRCFARRDLLLRHQQKLHSTTTPSSRPRSGRRESAAGVAGGRVRKNSVATGGASGTRPRANTLSHVDTTTIGMLANAKSNLSRNSRTGHSHHNSLSGFPGVSGFEYRGMSNSHHASIHGLPKLETTGFSANLSGGLKTAPPYGGFGSEFGMNSYDFGIGSANTINPHVLHLNGIHGLGIDPPTSPYQQMFSAISASQPIEDEISFDWMAQGFDTQMSFAQANESAIDTSSPSAMSTNSPGAVSEVMLDGSGAHLGNLPTTTNPFWPNPTASQPQMVTTPSALDFSGSTFSELLPAPPDTISPKSLLAQNGAALDMGFSTPPPPLSSMHPPSNMPHFYPTQAFHLPFSRNGGSASSTASMDSSLRQSSITTVSSELISDHTRNILITSLSQSPGSGQSKYSHPSASWPLSPGLGSRAKSLNINNFPSTQDLQRYISAYIQFFHPHLPFLHIPTLSFESPEYTTLLRSQNGVPCFGQSSLAGGGGCLVLAIAAIGALYEHEMVNSRELFESAKRSINGYLEERRKANMTKTNFGHGYPTETEDTPLWLVQAMLLNVIYGHNCGDKSAADTASRHCAALVSLARSAELARPYHGHLASACLNNTNVHQDMHMGGMGADGWGAMLVEPDDQDWHGWKVLEERKRTLYAVFITSSLLVSAYNHAPALTNSEIRLDLPCDEELWCAETAHDWRAMGGAALAESQSIAFSAALGHLLTAAQRQQRRLSHSNLPLRSGPNFEGLSENDLRPSTFGCLILVNALHNYIWETRQRHLGRQWTAQETEQMHAHIEPALRAWQAAWASNPRHSLQRPNPYGAGPLSADSIPLLDLAYVRLFVNLGRSKEAFWQRDFDAMADELARGADGIQRPGGSPSSTSDLSHSSPQSDLSGSRRGSAVAMNGADSNDKLPLHDQSVPASAPKSGQPTRRERHLRKAAFYAADSLSMSDKLGLSFAEHTSRELPLQSAMCAFDCAQVLAEWVTTVQERVGRYLGIMGKDEMDVLGVPGIMLLEDEDRKLLGKIAEVLVSAEHKMTNGSGSLASNEGGYGSKILILTAHMLERAAVWPVTKLMAKSLQTQAAHMSQRARKSTMTLS